MSNSPRHAPVRLDPEIIELRARELDPAWRVVDGARLERSLRFPDFASATAFAVRVACIAERADHHPELRLSWGSLAIAMWTHSVGGLSERDFEFAREVDRALGE